MQAVLGSAGLLVAGAALGGIMLGLIIAKAASDFFRRKEFSRSKALAENAVLRAKVRRVGRQQHCCSTAGAGSTTHAGSSAHGKEGGAAMCWRCSRSRGVRL